MILIGIEGLVGTEQRGPPRIDTRIPREGVANDNDITRLLRRLWWNTVRTVSYLRRG
jgi:hypothetical protein